MTPWSRYRAGRRNNMEIKGGIGRVLDNQRLTIAKQEQALSDISELIKCTGSHPSFILPPVSEFIKKLKEILNENRTSI